jgi:hypothetical protein
MMRVGMAVLMALTLAGCGKKPSFTEAPQGRAEDRFPTVYPNPALDPKPESKARPGTP